MKNPRALATGKHGFLARRRNRQRTLCAPKLEGLEGRSLLSVLTVTNDGDSGPGSLRERVAAAAPGDVITFAPSLVGDTIKLTSGEIDPAHSISIQGPGANLLAISGSNASRIFGLGAGVSLSISGITLENGNSGSGGAISTTDPGQSLNVSKCDFANNIATSPTGYYFDAYGGAIASVSPVTIDQCDFTGNLAVAANGAPFSETGVKADGGAIWVGGANLQVTNSHFTDNHATGGDGVTGGRAYGGAIAWVPEVGGFYSKNVSINVTGSSFEQNSALGGGGDFKHAGGSGIGGAVGIDAGGATSMAVMVSNNTFNNNSTQGGPGRIGGTAEGGTIAIDADIASYAVFHVDYNHIRKSSVIAGDSSAPMSDVAGHGGAAYGGAVALLTDGINTTFTFQGDEVTGAKALGGSAEQFRGGMAYAAGGDARGGGLYLDASTSDHAVFSVSGATFNSDKAIGGAGGNAGLNGLAGGDASGGAIAAVTGRADVYLTENAARFTIDGTTVTNSSATGGAGGNGIQPTKAAGGNGGNGGNSFGGGISIDAGDSFGAVFNVTNDQIVSDTAAGGAGGNAGYGAHGFKGGNGGSGGQGSGGGLAVTLGINGFGNEGNGTASVLRVNVAHSHLTVDEAIGGIGGYAGNGFTPGFPGSGGNAFGGAVSLRGLNGDPTNLVTLDTDFLFACTAQGGAGGIGGDGIASPGGKGGSGGAGLGGGLDVTFKGATHLVGSTVLGNHAVGGKGGKGGTGIGGPAGPGQKGFGAGGGIRVASNSGVTAAKDVNTLILVNSADVGQDVQGTLGAI